MSPRLRYIYSNQEGVTLADLLVTIAIFSIISTLLIGAYFAYHDLLTNQLSESDLELNNTIAMKKVTEATRGAFQIVSTKIINATSYTTSSNTLILELPSVDPNGSIISNKYDYQVFFLDPTDQTFLKTSLEDDPSSARTSFSSQFVARYINSLIFSYNNDSVAQASSVAITITSQKEVKQKIHSATLQTEVSLRNK